MENRDFDKNPFFKKDNYRALEALAQNLEKKYKLKNQQISYSRNDTNFTRLNYKAKQHESYTGQTSDLRRYTKELKEILCDVDKPLALFEMMISHGFTIRTNKSKTDPKKLTGYYITKSSISIKPSSIGFQISKLAEKFNVDEDGIAQLILRCESLQQIEETGEISAVPELDTKPKINRRESLYIKFQTLDGINYTSKDEKYNSRFSVKDNIVSFINPTELSIKAGIQALLINGNKGPFFADGNEVFKRKTWLVCALMGQEVINYQPNKADLCSLYERIQSNQKKYPSANIKLIDRHFCALKKESLEVDNLLNSGVSLSDLFPAHSASEIDVPEDGEFLATGEPEKPDEAKMRKADATHRKSKAKKLFDDQETDEKLLKLMSEQKNSLLVRFNL
ncbi:hypothetical protein QF043_005963 [Pseudomonas sp. W3I7]|uniref:hypothetical protein n=1 Tax=Pseudomonas sp. W3I7 TaxID=3042292 RepID=UPI002791ADFA|nr:hypothetical protein [Pseudomonas sp. W3I7]MDQ0707171.1 hypothetical protein [Pseudomonas sp. W3I7]